MSERLTRLHVVVAALAAAAAGTACRASAEPSPADAAPVAVAPAAVASAETAPTPGLAAQDLPDEEPPFNPCEGKTCGEPCQLCPPSSEETCVEPPRQCDERGVCSLVPPACMADG